MFNYPYGDNQQINLNWIISEIIALHKRLDPDYTAPSFTQIYPFSDTQQLNLDWILTELKALKELAPPAPALSSDDVSNESDVVGTTVTDALDNLLDAIENINLDSDNISNESTVSGATVTDALDNLQESFGNLDSDDIDNASQVTGATVTDALDRLIDAIEDLIEVSTNNTHSADNKLWIDEAGDSQIQVPMWTEFQALSTHVADMTGTMVQGSIAKGQNIPSTAVLDQTSCYKVGNVAVVCGRLHTMDFVATDQNAEVCFRLPTGFWPPALVRTAAAYVHSITAGAFMPAIATINANNGYVTFALGTTAHYDQIAFSATFPIREV